MKRRAPRARRVLAPLPPQLVERARRARRVLEVGAGRDFSTALALREAAPDADIVMTDVDERVLLAPLGLRARRLDVTRPDLGDVDDVDLVVGVRLPEELQVPTARLAHALAADLAVRALKDEWADVGEHYRRHETWGGGWRFYPLR